jgi:prepilin-type N-terminal cleavage/methylation domain-containing protein
MVTTRPRPDACRKSERGFSLAELLVVMVITTGVVGSAVVLTTYVQRAYSYEMDDATVQQEVRFAMEWITRVLGTAGSNPYKITVSACPTAGTTFAALRLDPNGDGVPNDVRVQADVGPPNGLLLGLSGACTEPGEDITIAHDAVNSVLTRWDRATDISPVAVTDQIFTQLQFAYLTTTRAATTNPSQIAYVQVSLTGRSRGRDTYSGQNTLFTYQSEVRVRAR